MKREELITAGHHTTKSPHFFQHNHVPDQKIERKDTSGTDCVESAGILMVVW